jgi:hypothetical protein
MHSDTKKGTEGKPQKPTKKVPYYVFQNLDAKQQLAMQLR